MTITWRPGPPPGRGAWWIIIDERVLPVDVSPALVDWNNLDAPLLLKMLGGGAYPFETAKEKITHHAALNPPEGPRPSPQPRPKPDGLSEKPCRECGVRHELGEFPVASFAYTTIAKTDGKVPIPAGARVFVREWSQYGGPIYYRVHLDGQPNVRENYSPCELEKS